MQAPSFLSGQCSLLPSKNYARLKHGHSAYKDNPRIDILRQSSGKLKVRKQPFTGILCK